MSAMARLLVIHQDIDARASLIHRLTDAGHTVRSVPRVRDSLEELVSNPPDVVVIGFDATDEESVESLEAVRRVTSAAVLAVTRRSDEAGATRLLRGGADSVLPRPWAAPLLLARVRALLRRTRTVAAPDAVVVGGLRVEPRRRVAVVDGRTLCLTPREFELLLYLARRPRQVVSRRTILAEVWESAYVDPQTVDVHLSCLRRKLGESASRPRYLWTVRGVGVRLEPPEDDALAVGTS
ncbi:response regulator transcription factor [Kineosporia sp. R_H_3]|uniref:response regulator transcription factor n=1 Tax=Kineosporia sp. R_H_3 TaxID=1961848 RepID=UPI001E3B7E93|nr:response regulator transcription factor [Kineosporia sp. R_H_3]